MAYTYLKEKFTPPETKNTIMELWELTSEEFVTRAIELENAGIAVIKASVNLEALEKESGTEVISDLLSQYVTAKFFEQLLNRDYGEEVEALLTGFWDTIKTIKEAQEKSKITPEEDSKKIYLGLEVFN